jgi:hypothetical protein
MLLLLYIHYERLSGGRASCDGYGGKKTHYGGAVYNREVQAGRLKEVFGARPKMVSRSNSRISAATAV